MSSGADPRIFFAAERTLLAWQRGSLALMGFGFVIERFSLVLTALRRVPDDPSRHLFSLLVGVFLILLGSGAAAASTLTFRRFVATLPSHDVPHAYRIGLGAVINLIIAFVGLLLAGYVVLGVR